MKRSDGENHNQLSSAERYQLNAYTYGFRRVFLNDHAGCSPIDRDGAWYDEKIVDQVERMYRRAQGCEEQWPSCRSRWDHTGFICCAGCRPLIPGYYQKPGPTAEERAASDRAWNEARDKRIAERLENDIDWEWRYHVAAAYRWAHSHGQTMPSGLADNDPRVVQLVESFKKAIGQQA